MTTPGWWAMALCEAVNDKTPLAVAFAGEELVLFRNAEGQAFALEDRCPHRRVPLALGRVVAAGLQCGYHGWTFDGASGRCTQIPNLRTNEPVPPRYAARAFPVSEGNGFVHVWLGEGVPDIDLPTDDYRPVGQQFTGSTIVNMSHEQYLAAMLDGPECLLNFAHVRMTDFFLGDVRKEHGRLVLERGAVWTTQILPSNFVVDYPLIVRTEVPVQGGSIRVDLLSEDETPLISLAIASGANRRGTTSLCWRGFVHAEVPAKAPLRWRTARVWHKAPFTVNSLIDGSAVAALLEAPSRDLHAARPPRLIPVSAVV
ncbi:Rieske 2Fe-2S domain-containing protein [Pseudomonas turukhanskensis]|uniref:Rieske iron-sulfur protein n=1 Tax=Pseudomonas turukhanskensis TaxID=1806536 RepID=A0A9W6NGS5_9PSED|nr:Rieske 2Fe-2S domain-containing protein [Pseudomonas turukhanskensis]GLK91104.1 Rieske iron-sulfur protein [Pseudomonas turukhanskensis]